MIITAAFVVAGGTVQAKPAMTVISQDQRLMLTGAKYMATGDFRAAETSYSQAIAANANNINAHSQRALARRELGNTAGMEADARRVIALVNASLPQNPNSADLYYQRSLAERLLKQFDNAEKDLRQAIQLNNNGQWDNDLKAIQLEKRMALQ